MVQLSITEQQLFFYILTNINKTSLAITTTDISYKLRYNCFINVKVEDGTWAQTYDVLIETIKATTDNELRYEMMHMAEDMLMETGCITPIYYYTDPYMISNDVEGFFTNPLGYKYFAYTTIG